MILQFYYNEFNNNKFNINFFYYNKDNKPVKNNYNYNCNYNQLFYNNNY